MSIILLLAHRAYWIMGHYTKINYYYYDYDYDYYYNIDIFLSVGISIHSFLLDKKIRLIASIVFSYYFQILSGFSLSKIKMQLLKFYDTAIVTSKLKIQREVKGKNGRQNEVNVWHRWCEGQLYFPLSFWFHTHILSRYSTDFKTGWLVFRCFDHFIDERESRTPYIVVDTHNPPPPPPGVCLKSRKSTLNLD